MREALKMHRSKMVPCPQFRHALRQMPALKQMGNVNFWCYFMVSAHVSDGLQQLEIHLSSGDLSPMLPSWRDEPHPPLQCIVQMHAMHFVIACRKTVTLTQNHFLCECKPWNTSQMGDSWRSIVKISWLSRQWNVVFPSFWGGKLTVWFPHLCLGVDILPGEISLVCGFVYADLSITCFLGWERFAQI